MWCAAGSVLYGEGHIKLCVCMVQGSESFAQTTRPANQSTTSTRFPFVFRRARCNLCLVNVCKDTRADNNCNRQMNRAWRGEIGPGSPSHRAAPSCIKPILLSSRPSRRDLDTFDRWFEWSFHSVVVDPSDDPLLREELRFTPARSLTGVGDGLNY